MEGYGFAVTDPGFPQKLHEIERILTRGGELASKVLPCRSATDLRQIIVWILI